MKRWLFFIVKNGVMNDESLTVSLYPSGCGEDEANIEGNVYARTAVPTQINRTRKLILSPTVNTTGVTCEPTALRLAQGPLLLGSNCNIIRGQTPFSPFHIWLLAGDWFLLG